jgi:soluble lytic murein transglycosylase
VSTCGQPGKTSPARARALAAALSLAGLLGLPCAANAFPGTDSSAPAVLAAALPDDPTAARSALQSALTGSALDDRSRSLIEARLGKIAFRAGDWEEALARFERAGATRVPDWVAFHRAESLFHLGRYAEAEAAHRALASRFAWSDWRHRAAFRVGDAQLGAGDTDGALKSWAAALKRYPEYPARAALRFAMARAEAAQGRLNRAAALYREIRKLDPGDPLSKVAARALADLEARGVEPLHPSPEERLAQALDLRRRKYYAEAISALETMRTEADVTGKVRDDVEWNIARCAWESERFENSLAAFRKIAAETKETSRRRKALRWIGYSLERLGHFDDAAKALAEASGRPTSPPAEVAEDIAWLYFNGAQYPKAETWFRRLPGKTHGLRWMHAWLTFRRGDFRQAGELFGGLARAAKTARERFVYWQARAAAAAGDQKKALELYRNVSEQSSIGYYGYQARARLVEAGAARQEPPAAEGAREPAVAEPEAPVPVLQTMVTRAGALFPAAAEALDLTLLGEARLASLRIRAISDELRAFRTDRPHGRALKAWSHRPRPYLDNREKSKTGEWGRSLDEPGPPADPRRGPALAAGISGEFMALLSRAFVALDDPHYARRHGSGRKLPVPPEAPGNRSAWAERFPRAFAEVLDPKARKYGLDPSLLWAFMTVESSYNPFAISRANARGLMQVMPQTGGLIADRMALRGFGTALLFEPEVTLEMAAWYVNALLEKFNGQSPLAIAAYNAGPHRVAAWLTRKGGLPMDEFIEEIPYDEAREYTKKVIRFWGLYRRIYQGRAGLSLDLRVDPAFKHNINF